MSLGVAYVKTLWQMTFESVNHAGTESVPSH